MAKRVFLEVRSGSAYYTLVGLSTQLRDYRLSFLLNKLPGFRFSRYEDLMIPLADTGEQIPFSVYISSDEENFNQFTLLSNRSNDHILLSSLRQTDYLLIIEGPFKKQQMELLLKELRTIPTILLAAEINTTSLKQFEQLLSDLELHRIANTKRQEIAYNT
ncbi:MAG: IPExxxVDY family protein [Bacteroidales bacterium]|nr:IPExxxVDY family protein [Bacteroidales bacterium]